MTVKNGQVPNLPNDEENNTPSSPTLGLKQGEALAQRIRASSLALLAVVEKLAHVGEGIIDVSDDPEFEAWEKEQEARREEVQRTLEEMKNLPYEERTKRIKAYLKAYIDAPSLLEKVRSRLQAEEQRKRNNELLRQFGQEHHTSIN